MTAPRADWHEVNTQVAILMPRVEQADGSARTGLTITDFKADLWDQADNNDYTKNAGAGAPGAPTIAVTVNEVADGLYEWLYTPDADGHFKLLIEYPTDGYVAQSNIEAAVSADAQYHVHVGVASTGTVWYFRSHLEKNGQVVTSGCTDGTIKLYDTDGAQVGSTQTDASPDAQHEFHNSISSAATADRTYYVEAGVTYQGNTYTSRVAFGTAD